MSKHINKCLGNKSLELLVLFSAAAVGWCEMQSGMHCCAKFAQRHCPNYNHTPFVCIMHD